MVKHLVGDDSVTQETEPAPGGGAGVTRTLPAVGPSSLSHFQQSGVAQARAPSPTTWTGAGRCRLTRSRAHGSRQAAGHGSRPGSAPLCSAEGTLGMSRTRPGTLTWPSTPSSRPLCSLHLSQTHLPLSHTAPAPSLHPLPGLSTLPTLLQLSPHRAWKPHQLSNTVPITAACADTPGQRRHWSLSSRANPASQVPVPIPGAEGVMRDWGRANG